MVEGWHRFHSINDDTKRIGFMPNGRSIRFQNRTRAVPPDENCFSLFAEKIRRSNINLTTNKLTTTTTTMMPTITTSTAPPILFPLNRTKQPMRSHSKTATTISPTLAKPPKRIHTGSSLNGMPTGDVQQHRHQHHHHNHQPPQQPQQQQHQHQRHHKTPRKTPFIPKRQTNHRINATNRNQMKNRANNNSSALMHINSKSNSNNYNNNNNNHDYNNNNRSSFRHLSINHTSSTIFGSAPSNYNESNISDRYGNRSESSSNISGSSQSDERLSNNSSSIISNASKNNRTKQPINVNQHHPLSHYRHSPHNKHQLPFHVQTSAKNHNFQNDQSEQKPEIVQRQRNERKVVTFPFRGNVHSVHRSHSTNRSPQNSHSIHYNQRMYEKKSTTTTTTATEPTTELIAATATPKSPFINPTKKLYHANFKKQFMHKHLDNSQKMRHRHRHHHGDPQSLTAPQYADKP